MTTQVQVQSGSGGGLLVITTVQSDRITMGSTVQMSAADYQFIRGNTTTPATTVQLRAGPTSWTETHSIVETGTSRDLFMPQSQYALEVKGTGAAATSWDVRLEGSIDNSTWTEIDAHTNVAGGDGTIRWTTGKLSFYLRIRVAALTLGPATNIVCLVSTIR